MAALFLWANRREDRRLPCALLGGRPDGRLPAVLADDDFRRRHIEALLHLLKVASHRDQHGRQEAVVRYLSSTQHLRSFKDVQRICRRLDPYLGALRLREITGDVIWQITQGELKRGNEPATVNRYLATMRNLLRIARRMAVDRRDPKIRLLSAENERAVGSHRAWSGVESI